MTRNDRSVNILIVTDHFMKYAQAFVTPKLDSSNGCLNPMGEFSGTLWMA